MPTSAAPSDSTAGKSMSMQDVGNAATSSRGASDRTQPLAASSKGAAGSDAAGMGAPSGPRRGSHGGGSPNPRQRHRRLSTASVAVGSSGSEPLPHGGQDHVAAKSGGAQRLIPNQKELKSARKSKAQLLVTDQQRRIRQLEKDLSQSQAEIQRLRAQTVEIGHQTHIAAVRRTPENYSYSPRDPAVLSADAASHKDVALTTEWQQHSAQGHMADSRPNAGIQTGFTEPARFLDANTGMIAQFGDHSTASAAVAVPVPTGVAPVGAAVKDQRHRSSGAHKNVGGSREFVYEPIVPRYSAHVITSSTNEGREERSGAQTVALQPPSTGAAGQSALLAAGSTKAQPAQASSIAAATASSSGVVSAAGAEIQVAAAQKGDGSDKVARGAAPGGIQPDGPFTTANESRASFSGSAGGGVDEGARDQLQSTAATERGDAEGDNASGCRDRGAEKKASSRYWTGDEHERFLEGLSLFGPKDIKAIAKHVGTRNATQVRTHAQKYYLRLSREASKSLQQTPTVGGAFAGSSGCAEDPLAQDGARSHALQASSGEANLTPAVAVDSRTAANANVCMTLQSGPKSLPQGFCEETDDAHLYKSACPEDCGVSHAAYFHGWKSMNAIDALPNHVHAHHQPAALAANAPAVGSMMSPAGQFSRGVVIDAARSPEAGRKGSDARSGTPRAKRGGAASKKARRSRSSSEPLDVLATGDCGFSKLNNLGAATRASCAGDHASSCEMSLSAGPAEIGAARLVETQSLDIMDHDDEAHGPGCELVEGLDMPLNSMTVDGEHEDAGCDMKDTHVIAHGVASGGASRLFATGEQDVCDTVATWEFTSNRMEQASSALDAGITDGTTSHHGNAAITENRFSFGNLDGLEGDLEDPQDVALSIADHQLSPVWPGDP